MDLQKRLAILSADIREILWGLAPEAVEGILADAEYNNAREVHERDPNVAHDMMAAEYGTMPSCPICAETLHFAKRSKEEAVA